MEKDTRSSATTAPMPLDEGAGYTQQRAYAGDVLYTEGMSSTHMYVVKEGEVDIYLVREEKRIVLETLGKGQCFGMTPHLSTARRINNAAARTYCELYLVENEKVDAELNATPRLARGILGTLAERVSLANELIATRVNYQPDILVYANLLYLLGIADVGKQKAESKSGSGQPVLASPALNDVYAQARALLGQSDVHTRNSLGKLLMLHLIQIEDDKGNGKRVIFAPKDIVARARKIASTHQDQGKLDYDYVNVDEFSAMVDVDRGTLLKKLASSEFSEDIFTFRKSEILRLLNEKGRKFFYDRKIKAPEEFTHISDIEFADQKTIFEVISRCDVYDLAKLVSSIEEEAAKSKILSSLPRAKREELEFEMSTLKQVDPIEAMQLGNGIINQVKERMSKRL
jgi:CRP-like cAMP-binding protein